MGTTNFDTVAVDALEVAGVPVAAVDLSGVTASAAELNLLDGAGASVASGTQATGIADATAVAAITATSPGAAYVQAEAVAVYADVVALRATCADLRTKLNLAIAALEAFRITATV